MKTAIAKSLITEQIHSKEVHIWVSWVPKCAIMVSRMPSRKVGITNNVDIQFIQLLFSINSERVVL